MSILAEGVTLKISVTQTPFKARVKSEISHSKTAGEQSESLKRSVLPRPSFSLWWSEAWLQFKPVLSVGPAL